MSALIKEFDCPSCAGTERDVEGHVLVCRFCGNRWIRKDEKLMPETTQDDKHLANELYQRGFLPTNLYLSIFGYGMIPVMPEYHGLITLT